MIATRFHGPVGDTLPAMRSFSPADVSRTNTLNKFTTSMCEYKEILTFFTLAKFCCKAFTALKFEIQPQRMAGVSAK